MATGFIEVDRSTRRVVHHKIDQVGNNLTRTLMWCDRHQEPVWVFGDGSFRCWWDNITRHKQHLPECGPEDHEIVAGPWER